MTYFVHESAKADYLIIVKPSQEKLYEGILEGIRIENNRNKARWIDYAEEIAQGHGREEVCTCHSCSHLKWTPKCRKGGPGIKALALLHPKEQYWLQEKFLPKQDASFLHWRRMHLPN